MLGAISLAILWGLASLLAVAVLLLVPAALLSRFLGRIRTPSPVAVRATPREAGQGGRLLTRSST